MKITNYRLCVLASGSLITTIFISRTVIMVSVLHFEQNMGKFSSTVSSRIFVLVLLSQTGHNNHFSVFIHHHHLEIYATIQRIIIEHHTHKCANFLPMGDNHPQYKRIHIFHSTLCDPYKDIIYQAPFSPHLLSFVT